MKIMKIALVALCLLFLGGSQSMAVDEHCLGGVCLGDSIDKLEIYDWISGDKMAMKNLADMPETTLGAVLSFYTAKNGMDSYYKAKNNSNSIYIDSYLESEKKFIEKYVSGITDEEKISLNPYYKSNFFDNQALKIIKRVIACKGKILRGFRQTEHGNIDMVTIMPSASTGKFEVICIERQFPKMDDPQKEKIVSALKDRYPSIKVTPKVKTDFR